MGLLTTGAPLSWTETVPHLPSLKAQGIEQFIKLWSLKGSLANFAMKFGDEIEYILVKMDPETKNARVLCEAEKVLEQLKAAAMEATPGEQSMAWNPEFASYMVEGTPGVPYEDSIAALLSVEPNMVARRNAVQQQLGETEICLSISFPSLGVGTFTHPPAAADEGNPEAAFSLLWPQEAVFNGHVRFKNLSKNITDRRRSKVSIHVPIFMDEATPSPYMDSPTTSGETENWNLEARPDHILMDHMGFGMGLCCLQVTFQAADVDEARMLYDQLTPITPVLLALSAATPCVRGKLVDLDSRWSIISQSVDDRTPEERGMVESATVTAIPKSRYGTTSCYIASSSSRFNDTSLLIDEDSFRKMVEAGIDEEMSRHVAHLFIRSPLQVFKERIEQDATKSTEHFETIQSSNWMNMRFKPPPLDAPGMGWRVEFRPTEVQLTDFENAAYCVFIMLITRVIKEKKLDFLVPISMVSENMERAQQRDAVLHGKFFFRHSVEKVSDSAESGEDIKEMSINSIVNGEVGGFPGLIPLIQEYLTEVVTDESTHVRLNAYLTLLSKRASGSVKTLARWTRDFVREHPAYAKDSDVNSEIVYDLMKEMDAISNHNKECEALLGSK
ncbi:hypothetical protein CAEBREN_21207 [Caenorhabditis brenneri]|uniref:Glutamate--cysteine ligase n=1 Tax=Caenorhabditis brenneri TaxID=135651 RepID=G0PK47_CAEBE|nr:hypothetical protein CAEBREN_21207 [Caenorhabditis brenneri]